MLFYTRRNYLIITFYYFRDDYVLLAYLSKQDVSINDQLQFEKTVYIHKIIICRRITFLLSVLKIR